MSSLESPSSEGPIWHFDPRSHIEQPACSATELAQRLRSLASGLGLAGLGFAPVEAFLEAQRAFREWVDADYHGTMNYLLSDGDRHDPNRLAPHSSTIVVAAVGTVPKASPGRALPLVGQLAAYAAGPDYHHVLRQKLAALGQMIADVSGRPIDGRACVDTAPLLEREAARRAGLGFIGKSNMLIIPGIGSQVLLGVLLVNIRIEPDSPREHRCGRCTTCLTACPTHAFVGPWLLDARRCIAYLTIEYKGWIALELRSLIGTRVFGCDVCQDVCPFNHGKVEIVAPGDAASENQIEQIDLHRWLTMSSSDYRRLTSGTALRRASRWQLLRNAAIAAGNCGDSSLVEPLVRLLSNSKYPIVRGHSAWALGRYRSVDAVRALDQAIFDEADSEVRIEIQHAQAEQLNHEADETKE